MRNQSKSKKNYRDHNSPKPHSPSNDLNREKKQSDGELINYIKDPDMISVLNKKGITKLFPIQYETFHHIYEGKDIMAKDRTGSGKTMAFSLPMICRMREKGLFKSPHTTKMLIVLPTRELAIQVKDEIQSVRLQNKEDFKVGAVYGGSKVQDQKEVVLRGLDILVGTPGRIIDFLDRGVIKLDDLEATCLDEADQMLKTGFKEDIQKIFQHVHKKKSKTQNLLFSATLPEWVWSISERYQTKDRPFIDLIKDKDVRTSPTVEHYQLKASMSEKQAYIGPIIDYFLEGKKGKVIIFCETKREVDKIGNSQIIPLRKEVLHGDIKQFMREQTFRKFKNNQIDCIVATNVAARGLDFPQIDLVIQMQPPSSPQDYIHRSGRTGRAGKKGACITLFSHKEENKMEMIEKVTKVVFHKINQNDLRTGNNSRIPRQKREQKEQRGQRERRDYRGQRDYQAKESYTRKPYNNEKEERRTKVSESPIDDFNY